mmetsp:Transcript_103920/g.282273  ORF Transcript_103920/g.282273 Transcript_103920/m.282273 type:complete len:230 (-) Transcript_103920:25-714(-)
MPRDTAQELVVRHGRFVGCQHDVGFVGALAKIVHDSLHVLARAAEDDEPHVGQPHHDLVRPVVHDREGHDDEVRTLLVLGLQEVPDEGEDLHRLPKSHVICEDTVHPIVDDLRQPAESEELVGQQLAVPENLGRGLLGAAAGARGRQLGKDPGRLLEDLLQAALLGGGECLRVALQVAAAEHREPGLGRLGAELGRPAAHLGREARAVLREAPEHRPARGAAQPERLGV